MAKNIYFVTSERIEKFSGSMVRAKHIIESLMTLGHKVSHGYFIEKPDTDFLDEIKSKNSEFSWGRVNWQSVFSADVIWLSHFWLNHTLIGALRILDQVKRLNPKISVVVDLCDMMLVNNAHLSSKEREITAYLESILVRMADCVVYVSVEEVEKARVYYGLDREKMTVISVPFKSSVRNIARSFSERLPHICMSGSTHPHNIASFRYALNNVWPLIAEKIPDSELHIIGKNTNLLNFDRLSIPAASRVKFIGEVDDLLDYVSRYRVQLATTVSGTGVKTKVLDSLSSKTPVVGTARCKDGLENVLAEVVLASNNSGDIAKYCEKLILDEEFWFGIYQKIELAIFKYQDVLSVDNQCEVAINLALDNGRKNGNRKAKYRNHIFLFSVGEIPHLLKMFNLLSDNKFVKRQNLESLSEAISIFARGRDERIYPLINSSANSDQCLIGSVDFQRSINVAYDHVAKGLDSLYLDEIRDLRFVALNSKLNESHTVYFLTSHFPGSHVIILFIHPARQWLSLISEARFKNDLSLRNIDLFVDEYVRVATTYLELQSIRPGRVLLVDLEQLRDDEYLEKLIRFADASVLNRADLKDIAINYAKQLDDTVITMFSNTEALVLYEKMSVIARKTDAFI
ncbi:MAG: glycosyltransferase family 4 protein [Pseudomonadota bacterium]|nr:glycosyltransferase family 4 protein [Pseudomonadota bacterium]